MRFSPELIPVTLLRRYKRFLADVRLADGSEVTAHCPNTGAMLGCAEPGSRAWVSTSDNPRRKYAHTLEIVASGDDLVGVHPGRANSLLAEALDARRVEELDGYAQRRPEAAVPDAAGRFDFLLRASPGHPDCWVEVKSVTLCRDGVARFPDAVSARALKHVEALVRRVDAGERGAFVFVVQHSGATAAGCAADIDPAYADGVLRAIDRGVEVLAYGAAVSPQGIEIRGRLPFQV
ncbi:MAG: DNA/RNA nuclease SfsA [Pseudomonadota bacterium]